MQDPLIIPLIFTITPIWDISKTLVAVTSGVGHHSWSSSQVAHEDKPRNMPWRLGVEAITHHKKSMLTGVGHQGRWKGKVLS